MSTKNQIVPVEIEFNYVKQTTTDHKEPTTMVTVEQKRRDFIGERPTPSISSNESSYSGRYNQAVKFFNHIATKAKRKMFGGFLLLYPTVICILILCLITTALSLWVQPVMAAPIFFSVAYLIISIYNLIIYFMNGSLLNQPQIIKDDNFRKFGHGVRVTDNDFEQEWVSINGNSTDFGDFLLPHMERINQLQDLYGGTSDRIDILFYSWKYEENYTLFPRRILLHSLVALILLGLGIVIPIIFHCKWNPDDSPSAGKLCYINI